MTTTTIQRLLSGTLVLAVGMNELFHTIFDGLNFSENVAFVGSVISMQSTIEPGSWKAISNPAAALIAYSLIWLAHLGSALLCLIASFRLFVTRNARGRDRATAVATATLGTGIACVLYLMGFLAIASGWFLLYTAPTPPNFLKEALLLFLSYVAVLIYLTVTEHFDAVNSAFGSSA